MTLNNTSESQLTIIRRCRAPRDLVWKAWTDPQHVAKWWGPFGSEKTTSVIELVVGGVYSVCMRAPNGSEHPSRGIISELIPHEKIVIVGDPNAFDACGGGLPPRAVVTILFEVDSLGTRVTLDAVFDSEQVRIATENSNYLTSWSATLDALNVYYEELMGETIERTLCHEEIAQSK